MANWAWLLLVCLGHNLCCWLQQLGGLRLSEGAGLRAKREDVPSPVELRWRSGDVQAASSLL
jgi:hypothetical protein